MRSLTDLATTVIDAVQDPSPERHRAFHAKGICADGSFTASGELSPLTLATHLRGGTVRAVVRFSNGGGNPKVPDGARDGRGMATRLELPGGKPHDFVAVKIPTFYVRTPDDFLAFLAARRPDPSTGAPDPARLNTFLAAHPESVPAFKRGAALPAPASFATATFHGIHAFYLVKDGGGRQAFRYRWEPEAGLASLTDEEAAKRDADYLQREIKERLGAGPVRFKLVVQLGEPGDPTNDATAAWPDSRKTILAGALTLDRLVADADGGCEARIFDPVNLVPGVELGDDPLVPFRSAAYGVSFARRRG